MSRFAEARRIRPFCRKFVSTCWVLRGFISWHLHRDALSERQVHAGAWRWLVVPIHVFFRHGNCCFVDLWAAEYQHNRVLYSTLAFCSFSLNQRTNQPIKQADIIEKAVGGMGAQIGLTWLSTGTVTGWCECGNEPTVSVKRAEFFDLLASQDGHCSTDLVFLKHDLGIWKQSAAWNTNFIGQHSCGYS
jgi:hypothetical protein